MKLNAKEKRIESFLTREGVNCLSEVDSNNEGYFSPQGCDICGDNLGNTVFDCAGFNTATNEIQDGYTICADCLYYITNGELPD